MIELITKALDFLLLILAPIIQWLERSRLEAEKREADRKQQVADNQKHEAEREDELSRINKKLKERETKND